MHHTGCAETGGSDDVIKRDLKDNSKGYSGTEELKELIWLQSVWGCTHRAATPPTVYLELVCY